MTNKEKQSIKEQIMNIMKERKKPDSTFIISALVNNPQEETCDLLEELEEEGKVMFNSGFWEVKRWRLK